MTGQAGALWRTPLARRFFGLFVVAALLPLALVASLSLSQVKDLLLQQGDQRLGATAKSFGMTVFERLQIAVDLAAAVAARPRAGQPDDLLAARAFNWLGRIDREGNAVALYGALGDIHVPAEARTRVSSGAAALLVAPDGATVRLAVPLHDGAHAVGEIKRAALWLPEDEYPAGVHFCVLEEGTLRELLCPGAPTGVAAAAHTPWSKTHVWSVNDETYRARTWGQFMRVTFGTPDWIVIASQPEHQPLKQLAEFRGLYLSAVALGFLIVLWFTVRQTRDIVGAVGALSERAKAIGRNEFEGPAPPGRDDEFGELAQAFEHMSGRIGRQIATLTALSEIDRLILDTQDTAHIVQRVVTRLQEVAPADLVTVTLFDYHNPQTARTFVLEGGASGERPIERHAVSPEERAALRTEPGGRWASPARGTASYLSFAHAAGMAHCYVQPIIWRGEACGAIVLAYREAPKADAADMERTRELADRVAVAVSSAWRDERLYAQAHFDALTNAPNRLLFADRLATEIARSEREDLKFALLFIDLDHFKHVNDSFGHTVGDQILREAAARISASIRRSDTFARLGGDEFTVLATHLGSTQEAWLIAETIVAALSREFVLEAQRLFLSASVGIAVYPGDGQSAEALLKNADLAMYRAKATGRAQAVFFEERMNAEAVMRMTLDRDLRMAIERGELAVHFQPKMEIANGTVRSAEALVRWRHPSRGWIPPAHFIPLAEESGFIETLGDWIIRQTCAEMRRWREAGLDFDHVSVNVSPRQFRRRHLPQFLQSCTAEAGFPCSKLQLEITEGLLVERGDDVEQILQTIARNGHGIALDDFGTGFSAMSYLKRFPVHTIKIDRAFVDGVDGDAESAAIATAIIAMSHALGKRVVAEGVETRSQLECLRRLGCDSIQGYLISPAVPAAEFAALLPRLTTPAPVAVD